MKQQDQTQHFFEAFAASWQSKALGEGEVFGEVFNIIEARHAAVLAVLDDLPNPTRVLDVGCGTGQLVISIASRGIAAEGIDFAPSMIEHCEANARAAGVDNASFVGASFFDVELEEGAYDLISAQGFIEYISLEELEQFLDRCRRALKPGGALAVGSRNRLLNAVSLNDFTRAELEIGTFDALVKEAIALHTSPTNEAAFTALRALERTDLHPNWHPQIGIDVDTRYQFTPADLAYRLRRGGLEATQLFPINFHAIPTALAAEQPKLQAHLSEIAALMLWLREHRLVPFCSSFVMRGDKSR